MKDMTNGASPDDLRVQMRVNIERVMRERAKELDTRGIGKSMDERVAWLLTSLLLMADSPGMLSRFGRAVNTVQHAVLNGQVPLVPEEWRPALVFCMNGMLLGVVGANDDMQGVISTIMALDERYVDLYMTGKWPEDGTDNDNNQKEGDHDDE